MKIIAIFRMGKMGINMRGWIALYRSSIDSAVFQNPTLWLVWCWCLLRANHKETKILLGGEEILLRPGEFISGRFAGARECHLPPSTFRNAIATLVRLDSLCTVTDKKRTIFRVKNWAMYQSFGAGQNKSGTANGQVLNTDKNGSMIKKQEGYSQFKYGAEEI